MNSRAWRPTFDKILTIIARRPLVSGVVLFLALASLIWHQWPPSTASFPSRPYYNLYKDKTFDGQWNYERDKDNLLLDQQQCDEAFPGLFNEIERAVESRRGSPITIGELDSIEPKNGYVRAMIYDQQLHVIAKQGGIYSREKATLHAIHRAILSSPERLPNIEFAFNTDDIIFESVALWGYARRPQDTHIWLIPDFGYWSWPETKVGTMREVQTKAKDIEIDGALAMDRKIPKLLWRGATMGLPLRQRLLEVTQGKQWADVVALDWHDKESMAHDLKSMPEHCQYKYLAHTEGNSYSGRLKYLQACESVIIAHKMEWMQHHHPLMMSHGPNQNYVEVDRNFDQLEAEISRLQQQTPEAKRIARNSVTTFRERYLTPAAEACYWRRLIHGWSEVSFEPQFYKYVNGTKEWRGLPAESFVLEGRMDWDPY